MSDGNNNGLGGHSYLSATSLLLAFRYFIESHPPLVNISKANPCWSKMNLFCDELGRYPKLMRSITVLHVSSQLDFERALFCSWGALTIAVGMNLSLHNQRALFYAGLLQDLGKYLDDEIKNYTAKTDGIFCLHSNNQVPDYSHPLMSSTYIEHLLPEVDRLNDLVLHHHAKEDGTGFPPMVGESQLDLDQQILIVANEISDRLDRLNGHNQLAACLPGLKLGSLLYFNQAHEAWLRLISPHVAGANAIADRMRTCIELRVRLESLGQLFRCLLKVSGELLRYDFDVLVRGLRTIISKLMCIVADTGVLNPAALARPESVPEQVCQEMTMVYGGIPEVLERCLKYVKEITRSRSYELDLNLLSECEHLLQQNIREFDNNPFRFFR